MSVPGSMFSYMTDARILSSVVRTSRGSASLSNSVLLFLISPFIPFAALTREKDKQLFFPVSVNSEESSEVLYGKEYLPFDVDMAEPLFERRLSISVKRPFSSSSWISVS